MPAIYHEGSWLGNATDPEVLVKDTVGWTGKNLLKNTAVTKTERGITFTVDSKKRITLNGTQDGTGDGADIYINGSNSIGKRLKLSDYPSSFIISAGINIPSSITVAIWLYNINETFLRMISIPTNSSEVLVDVPNDAVYFIPYIRVNKNQTVSNITVSYMIRDASITDPTYEPYHESVEEEIEQIYADNGVLGAKNLLKIPDNVVTKTISGVTFTVNRNSKGEVISIVANGTATATVDFAICSRSDSSNPNVYDDGKYIGSGCPSGGSVSTYMLYFDTNNSDGTINRMVTDVGNGGEFTITDNQSSNYPSNRIQVLIRIANRQTVSNLIFKPMIRLASDPDDTYQPYAMTNRELTVNMLTALFSHPIRLTSSDDLDNVKTAGIYEITNSVPANAPSGLSSTTFSTVFVLSAGGSAAITQIYIQGGWRSTDKHIAIRGYGSSPLAWSAWRYITDSES